VVNRIILLGNLGRDPDLRYTQSGQAVANFSLACSEKFKGKDGQPQERTGWIKVTTWGPLAENCQKYLKKGRQAYVEGKIQTRQYQDKQGVTKSVTEVVAHTVKFLGDNRQQGGTPDDTPYAEGGDVPEDSIPY
jgi:single-strand DNA-binding protein